MQTEAEKAARALAEKEGFEIATIHPAFVMGPVIAARADATSIVTMKVSHAGLPCCLGKGAHTCLQLFGNDKNLLVLLQTDLGFWFLMERLS